MAAKLLIFFAASATAQITTSFWMPNLGAPRRLKYDASVVGADQDRLTLAFHPRNDSGYVHPEDIFAEHFTQTFTLASTLMEFSTSDYPLNHFMSGYEYSYKCEMQTEASTADCTASAGLEIVRRQCYTGRPRQHPETRIVQWTFTESGTTGVETYATTVLPETPGTRSIPGWCADAGVTGPIPSSALRSSFSATREDFGTFTFVITAGEEKISATTGGAATTETIQPTGSGSSTGAGSSTENAQSTATSTQGTGAAAPIKTMMPALAGLGAAVAVFL